VLALAADATEFEPRYGFDPSRAIFYPQGAEQRAA
jgi:hypothetical protein